MRASAILSLALIGLASAARRKANEYKSSDCSGPINYGHVSSTLRQVTMDDTTHSVYITGDSVGYTGKSGNGGHCTGEKVVKMQQGCNNLNNMYRLGRINCVRFDGYDGGW